MKKLFSMIAVLSIGFLLAACSEEELAQYSPDQIVAKAVEENGALDGYYMKAQFEVFQGEEKIDDSIIEQWNDNKNGRTKVASETANGEKSMSVNDGEKVIFYSSLQDEAFEMDSPEMEGQLAGQTHREQMDEALKRVRETHNIEIIGEEELNGFNTYHIKAVPKKEDAALGEEEYWITTDHWFIVKNISKTDELSITYTVNELKVNPSFDENTFVMDLPEGVEIKPLDETDPAEEVTLAEAAEIYGQPVLTSKDYDLVMIDKFEMESFNRTEVNQQFEKDSIVQFLLTSFESPEGEGLSAGMESEEEIQVRGVDAVYMDDVIQNLIWDEDGLRYSLLAQNADLTKEDLIEIAENLEFVEE
ncbi:hypothetical protein SAMN04487944_12110 [Gracilibacillus ureilyticus]|uniref:DUF4367 domain-containing protein n=1 Tax=Gracilibacillus ureilyticus TaxID=531814 RepID=A0A1H9V2L6_9BACI|nr:DUF4367 domain-containing protein [Gracilibacillus ureilyticus]SES15945.1 hypothetical protein SAMN04487944_12110 [Gracilibacillus ureilyticus]